MSLNCDARQLGVVSSGGPCYAHPRLPLQDGLISKIRLWRDNYREMIAYCSPGWSCGYFAETGAADVHTGWMTNA